MTAPGRLSHRFVEFMPEQLEEGTVYVSVEYGLASHKCCCGCGAEVVTPLSPTGWKLIYDGESVSLEPSIGNWSYPCQSHYWIRRNRVQWAAQWSKAAIEECRTREAAERLRYYETSAESAPAAAEPAAEVRKVPKPSLWERSIRLAKRLLSKSARG